MRLFLKRQGARLGVTYYQMLVAMRFGKAAVTITNGFPANALLAKDGVAILAENGEYILTE